MKNKNTPLFYFALVALALLLSNAKPNAAKLTITEPINSVSIPANFELRLNCGGGTTVQNGTTFQQDAFFVGSGKSYTNPNVTEIANTQDDDLYFSERSALSNLGSFGYAIPVPNGTYDLNLHFAEIYWGATGGGAGGSGKRVFNVALEGQNIMSDYDINEEVGSMTAVIKSFTVLITDGVINLDFSASVDQPKISALEIIGEDIPNDPALFRINCGGASMVLDGLVFQEDDFFTGAGKPYSNTNIVDIAGTDMDDLYFTERSARRNRGSFGYAIPVPNGTYDLNLHFAEIYWGATGGGPGGSGRRIFDVELEGDPILVDYDINAEVGPMTATVKSFQISVSDGTLNIDFSASKDQPKISAIEVLESPEPTDNAMVRINCGGSDVTYPDRNFISDIYFGGQDKTYTNPNITGIANTEFDEVYLTERSTKNSNGEFQYYIPITNGTYTLKLHFAEIYWGATGGGPGGNGKRVFDVWAEGNQLLASLDINQEVGSMTALVKTFDVTVLDEELTLEFSSSVDQPKLSAIEIFGDGEVGIIDPNGCIWNDLPASALEKVESQSAKVNDKLYVFSGYDKNVDILSATEIFDPSNNTWTLGASMPVPKNHCGTVAVDEEVWLIGGFVGDHPGPVTTDVQIYNTVTDSWSFGPSLPQERGSCTAVLNERKLHVFGGVMADRRTDMAEHLVLDLDDVASGWQTLAPLPNPRNHLSSVNIDGQIYAIGGQFNHDINPVNSAILQVYDPLLDAWTNLSSLPVPRSHTESSTVVHNGSIIIAGGVNDVTHFDNIISYDPFDDSWVEICKLPEKLLAPTAKIFDDRMILTNGGVNGNCCPSNETRWVAVEPEIISAKARISSVSSRSSEMATTVYPNPSSEKVTLGLQEKEDVIEVLIYDTMGRQLGSQFFQNTRSFSVDLDQTPGIYLLKVQTSSGKKSAVRVVKK
ncbi:MAG: malectin domain-containing carbohydrate-binding protein [Flavobacteriaceae bacterium]